MLQSNNDIEMKVLLFNGAGGSADSTAGTLTSFLSEKIASLGAEAVVYSIDDNDVPLFSPSKQPSPACYEMVDIFTKADAHIWLSPLYHGGMPGAMKNCLDWLELSAKSNVPYLTDKKVGLVCWAQGAQAMQGINNMDAVAKALRGWTLPYSIPVLRKALFTDDRLISEEYSNKFDLMVQMLLK